jgi:predicted metalloprotease with PDZ domain
MKGDLLWVYEGLTEYLGQVLARRSDLWSPEDYRERLAQTAASLDNKFGRTWRPLEDTAVAAQVLYDAGNDYADYRRGVDFYPEGVLIWLDVDVTIRQLSQGKKSLDDFCRAFEGGESGAPALKPYGFADVVAALNAIEPYDWAGFLNQRLNSTDAHAPLGGIQHAGWKLVYDGERSDFWKAYEDDERVTDLSYSVGLKVKEDGTISDIAFAGPAAKAGIAPATRLIAVNNRQFMPTVLREAIEKAGPLDLLIRNGEYYQTYRVDYRGGERYPHLVRDNSMPDLLTAITSAKTKK